MWLQAPYFEVGNAKLPLSQIMADHELEEFGTRILSETISEWNAKQAVSQRSVESD